MGYQMNNIFEKNLNRLGQIISWERQRAEISVKELATGICSDTCLLQFEEGMRNCEKIVAETLLQRLGVSSERFLYFLCPQEKEWLLTRDALVQAVNFGEHEKARRYYKLYEQLTVRKNKLHRQFLLVCDIIIEYNQHGVEVCLEKIAENLIKAWKITKEKHLLDKFDSGRMSFNEILIKALYFEITEDRDKKKEGYRSLLGYIDEYMDERAKAKFYPQIAYRLLNLLDKNEDDEAESIYEKSIGILKRQGGLYCLTELLEYKINSSNESFEEEKLMRALRWLYKTYNVPETKDMWKLSVGTEEIFIIADIVKGRRHGMGLTQEQLCEGICEPVSLSRIENGVVGPKTMVLLKLMNKLRFPSGSASLSLQVGNRASYETAEKIRSLRKFSRYEELTPLIAEFKKNRKDDIFSEQYLLELESTTAYSLKQLDAVSYEKNIWKAFHMTVPDKGYDNLKDWVFTRTEAMLVNMFSYVCGKINKTKEGILWLKLVKDYYEHQPFEREHYIDGYELTLRNLGNLLGNRGEYEEAIEWEDIAIELALKVGKGDIMRLTAYDRAWNMEKLWGRGYTKEESRPYMWSALQIEKFFGKKSSVDFVEKHWRNYYCED